MSTFQKLGRELEINSCETRRGLNLCSIWRSTNHDWLCLSDLLLQIYSYLGIVVGNNPIYCPKTFLPYYQTDIVPRGTSLDYHNLNRICLKTIQKFHGISEYLYFHLLLTMLKTKEVFIILRNYNSPLLSANIFIIFIIFIILKKSYNQPNF